MVLAGKICVVLGGGGFLGTHLCCRLVAEGARVTAFGRTRHFPDLMRGVSWIGGDIKDAAGMATCIEGADIVYHLVSTSTPASAEADTRYDYQSNVDAALSLLNACQKLGVRRVIFSSSGGTIYGASPNPPFAENVLPDPISSYAVTKLAIEHYFRLYNHRHGMRNIILRIANPFGPLQLGQKNQGAVGIFARKAICGEEAHIWGDGNVTRDYIYVDDVVDAFVRASSYEGHVSTFNIGRSVGVSLNDLMADIERILNKPVRRRYLPPRQLDVPVSILDIQAAARELDWRPLANWDASLEKTIRWLQSQPSL